MIKTQVIGHLGKDAVISNVNGAQVINFSVAHSEKWKGKDGVVHYRTTWVECAYWTESAKIAEYLRKGQQVWVEGIVSADCYTNNNGQVVPVLRLRVNGGGGIQLLGKSEGNNQNNAASTPAPTVPPADTSAWKAASPADDDLPF